MMFRLTLGLILMLMGGSLIGNAIFFYPSLAAILRCLAAVVLGAPLLAGGISFGCQS